MYEKLGVEERLKKHPEERLTASAILYSRTRNEVWMVGDCQAIIAGKLYENGKPYEEKIARKRVELIAQGLSPAEARKQIEPLLIEAMLSGQNQTYTVIDGFPIYREGVKVVSVSDSCSVQDPVSCSGSASASDTILSSSSEIVLASDGYPFLKPTLAASEAALAEQIANMHTLFNISTTILLIPFGNYLAKLATKILPEKEEEKEHHKHLNNYQ